MHEKTSSVAGTGQHQYKECKDFMKLGELTTNVLVGKGTNGFPSASEGSPGSLLSPGLRIPSLAANSLNGNGQISLNLVISLSANSPYVAHGFAIFLA